VYGVREDRRPALLDDFQTADLGREQAGWTRWGVETRGGSFKTGTQILRKEYLAGASLLIGIRLREVAPVSLDDLASALDRPARPVFLGRRSCPPAGRVVEGVCQAKSVYDALQTWEFPVKAEALRGWWPVDEGPGDGPSFDVWDLRDFVTDNFTGSRRMVEGHVRRSTV
jgi:CRISPR system Cascade subunit CasD